MHPVLSTGPFFLTGQSSIPTPWGGNGFETLHSDFLVHALRFEPIDRIEAAPTGSARSRGIVANTRNAANRNCAWHSIVAWLVRRTYYLLQMPGKGRRLRIISEWTFALLFRLEIVKISLDSETISLCGKPLPAPSLMANDPQIIFGRRNFPRWRQ